MSEQDPAALVAEAREKAHFIMDVLRQEGFGVQPENDLILRLTAALEAALADAARMRGFGIPRSVRALAIAACDAVGLSSADDFDAVERAIEMELDVHNLDAGDVPIVVVARAALALAEKEEDVG